MANGHYYFLRDNDLSLHPSEHFRTWGYLCQLFYRPWYKRLWVFTFVLEYPPYLSSAILVAVCSRGRYSHSNSWDLGRQTDDLCDRMRNRSSCSDTASLLRKSWHQERDGAFTPFIIKRWEQMISEAAGIRLTLESSIYKEFTDVLFRGRKAVGGGDNPSFHERYTVWRGHNSPPKGWGADFSPEERYSAFIGSFEHQIIKRVLNSQMFITSQGVIGVVAENCHVEVRDSVYVLLGGNTPFIMRRLLADKDYDNKEFLTHAWDPVGF